MLKKNAKTGALLRFILLLAVTLLLTLLLLLFFLPREKAPQTEETPTPKTERVIYLDPGHGDFDFGATATLNDGTPLYEKELVLSLALDAADALRARGYSVQLSRTDDRRHTYTTAAAEVYARRADAEEKGARYLLSIHANAYAGEGRAFGPRVYYDPATPGAKEKATLFAAAITEACAPDALRECRTVPDGSFAILGARTDVALLFECGFLSDPAERELLSRPAYRARLSRGIANGIERILCAE